MKTIIVNFSTKQQIIKELITIANDLRINELSHKTILRDLKELKNFRDSWENTTTYILFEEKGVEFLEVPEMRKLQRKSIGSCGAMGSFGHIVHAIKMIYTE